MRKALGLCWIIAAAGLALLLAASLACTTEVEVPGETVVVEKEVVKEIEVPGETVVVEKEVVKQVEIPGQTVVVEKEVVKQVEVPGQTVVVEKIVVATPLPEPQQSGRACRRCNGGQPADLPSLRGALRRWGVPRRCRRVRKPVPSQLGRPA